MAWNEHHLDVYLAGTHCGSLKEDQNGALSFQYAPTYDGIPLSLSMPIGLPEYKDRAVRPYLMGLLPDDESTRTAIGAPYGISADNPFRLLSVIGFDCPGAVEIRNTDDVACDQSSADDLIHLSDNDIASKLATIRANASAAWVNNGTVEGHWSLGGCQAKIALRKQNGEWFECKGRLATTHILKPGVEGFDHQALVEYLSMQTAHEIGLPVAATEFQYFQDEPAIIIERYDRMVSVAGEVARIHQEDFCQALGVSPARKYAEQGGPNTPQIIDLLRRTGRNSSENIYRFILYLFFNYLIGATDAHAKNHSLLFMGKDDIRIAPLYDVASIAPYRHLSPQKRKPLRAALSIGGENRFGMLEASNVRKMVEDCALSEIELDAELLIERLRTMAALVPDALERAIDEAHGLNIPNIDCIAADMVDEIKDNCSRTLNKL